MIKRFEFAAKYNSRNSQHQFWTHDNHAELILTEPFFLQKLNYIHQNPVGGKWMLAANAIEYLHSSAKYYYTQKHGIYPVLNFTELNDMTWAIGNAGI